MFIVFLGRLLGRSTRKIFLIVDRLKAHETETVEEWVADAQGPDRVVLLADRAPEQNPDEYLNNDLKGSIQDADWPAGE